MSSEKRAETKHDALTADPWKSQPQAAAFVKRVVDDFLAKLPEAAAFADRLHREAGVRFSDLVKTIGLHGTGRTNDPSPTRHEIEAAGWVNVDSETWQHFAGILPVVRLTPVPSTQISIRAEDATDFMAAHGLPWDHNHERTQRLAEFGSWGRGVCFFYNEQVELYVGEDWIKPSQAFHPPPEKVTAVIDVTERFRLRRRRFANELDAFAHLDRLLDESINSVGRDCACSLFIAAEREYWQRRNAAARFQKARQDGLGIGWANHDHHAYRSSRRHFHRLIGLWEKLGFTCRERFACGEGATCGVQVMEQPICGLVTVNTVDLDDGEAAGDFAHEPLAERDPLGPVGLWCALHGESVLQAGLHALGCRLDVEAAREQLAAGGIKTTPAITASPHKVASPRDAGVVLRDRFRPERTTPASRGDAAFGAEVFRAGEVAWRVICGPRCDRVGTVWGVAGADVPRRRM